MKIAKFIGAAMKAMKNPQLLGNLEGFHKSLIIHMQYLEAREVDAGLDDFQRSFLTVARDYLDFLKSIGAEIDSPQSREVSATPPS